MSDRDIPNLVKAMKVHAEHYPHTGGNVPIDRFDLAALCEAIEAQWAQIETLTERVTDLEISCDAAWERGMGEDL